MTIKQLLDGVQVKWLHVNIIEKVSPNQYIVGDSTGLAIMEVSSGKHVEVGQGLKLIKPRKDEDDSIVADDKFTPMKTKPLVLAKVDKSKITDLKKKAKKKAEHKPPQTDYIDFNSILNDYQENTVINKILVYVVSVSRVIDGTYGEYQICNMRDTSSTPLTLSLYKPHVKKLQDNQVYSLTKVKKNILKNDGAVRLSTTKYSQIQKGSSLEEKMFQNVQVADHIIEGSCVMYTNLSHYKACSKHFTKLTDDGKCEGCQVKIDEADVKHDFHCLLQVEDQEHEDLVPILIFRRHLNFDAVMNETEIEEKIEQFIIGQIVKIQYNDGTGETNVAVKVEIQLEEKTG